jgi:hypothetical protein
MGTRKKAKLAGMIVPKVTRVSLLRAAVKKLPPRISAERHMYVFKTFWLGRSSRSAKDELLNGLPSD